MDGNPFEETMTLRSDVGALLAEMPIFSGLDATLLREIASAVEWLSMPGGEKLFSAGDPPDALYMVLSGCLGAFSPIRPGDASWLASRRATWWGRWD